MSRLGVVAIQLRKQVDPVFDQPAHQKVLTHRLSGARADPVAERRISQYLHDALGGLLNAIDKEAILIVLDLMLYPSDIPANDCGSLPHGFGDSKAETL